MALLGKVRFRKQRKEEKRIQSEKASIQAEYELEKRTKKDGTLKPVPTQKFRKKFTTKQWNKFTDDQKQILSNRYEVILTDHETRKEKWTRRAKQVNLKNFDKGMKKFDEKQKEFWNEFDKGFENAGMSKSKMSVMGGSKPKDNAALIFGKTKKSKSKQVRIM